MRKNEKINYFYNLIYRIITVLYPLILTPYTARIFGAHGVGVYTYTISIVTYFSVVLTCVGRYGFREIAYCNGDIQKESKTFWEIFFLKGILFLLLTVIYVGLIIYQKDLRNLFIVEYLWIVFALFDLSWFFQGKGNFKSNALIGIFDKVLLIFLIFTLVKNENDLVIYALLIGAVTLFGSLLLWPKLLKYINKPQKINIRKHFKECLWLCLPFILLEFYSIIDKTMLGAITDNPSEVGYYEQTLKIVKIIMVFLTSMGLIKASSHSKLFSEGKYDSLNASLMDSLKFVFFMGIPIMLGLVIIAKEFVPFFFGPGYDKVVLLLYLYCPFVIIHGLTDWLANQYFIPTKKQNIYTISVVISFVSNVILNLIFIYYFNSKGAIIATVMSELVSLIVLFIYARNTISIKIILGKTYKFILSGIIMFIFCGIFIKYININNSIVKLGFVICLGAIVYFVSLIILKERYLKSLTGIFNKIIRRVNSR